MRTAEEIVQKRTEELLTVNAENQLKDLSETPLSDFISILVSEKHSSGKTRSSGQLKTADNLGRFRPGAKLCDIDKRFCTDYADWLLNTYKTRAGKMLAPYTVFGYFWMLGSILHSAYTMGYIRFNPWTQLDTADKFQAPETEKRFLSPEEIRKLEAIPLKNTIVKQAFLFSCHCGLRISDVRRVRWSDIYDTDGRWFLSIIMKKTGSPLSVPLSESSLRWLPEREDANEYVFEDLPSDSGIRYNLRKWTVAAGLGDNIHFHVSRHTFGTMMLTAGADLYTTSKLMGHADVRTTQIYAKIIDSKKIEAVDMVDKMFQTQ